MSDKTKINLGTIDIFILSQMNDDLDFVIKASEKYNLKCYFKLGWDNETGESILETNQDGIEGLQIFRSKILPELWNVNFN